MQDGLLGNMARGYICLLLFALQHEARSTGVNIDCLSTEDHENQLCNTTTYYYRSFTAYLLSGRQDSACHTYSFISSPYQNFRVFPLQAQHVP